MTYKLRTGDHPIEREVSHLIESEFPEFENFWINHLQPLKEGKNWKNHMIEYLEYIGMANFAVLKSINYINRNKDKIVVGDPDQKFKSIYFHFGLISDCIEDLSRNIVLIQVKLKIRKHDIRPQTKKELTVDFNRWVKNRYRSSCKDLVQKGKAIVYFPNPKIKFTSLLVPRNSTREYHKLIESLRKYRNFYTHNPGVDVIGRGNELFVIRRNEVTESRSWARLKYLIERSTDKFINPIEQVNIDLKLILQKLRVLWVSFDIAMNEIESHKKFKEISTNFQKGVTE